MKKTSQNIHRQKAEKKAKRDRKRARAGHKPHKGISMGPSRKQANPLNNPLAQLLALNIRLYNRSSKAERQKMYERRKT